MELWTRHGKRGRKAGLKYPDFTQRIVDGAVARYEPA
jgi:hypothetical protein